MTNMAPNLSSNPQDDAWSQALFNNQEKHSLVQASTTSELSVAPEVGLINRVPLIPVDYKTKLPASHSIHSFVPLIGLFIAFGVLGVGQYLIPTLPLSSLAPDNFTWNRAYSLISVPTSFLLDKTKATTDLVGNKTLSALAIASVFPEAVIVAVDDAFGTIQTDTFDQPKALALGVFGGVSGLLNQPVVGNSDQVNMLGSGGGLGGNNQVGAIGSLSGGFSGLTSTIRSWSTGILDFILYYVDLISNNWYNFFFGPKEAANAISPAIDEATLRAQIKAEVLADLKGTLAEALKSTGGSQPVLIEDSGGQGVVVVPSSASTTNETIKNQIKNLFSDPVLVDFDKTGQSGIITPIFSNTTGENYIFVLTPVKSN